MRVTFLLLKILSSFLFDIFNDKRCCFPFYNFYDFLKENYGILEYDVYLYKKKRNIFIIKNFINFSKTKMPSFLPFWGDYNSKIPLLPLPGCVSLKSGRWFSNEIKNHPMSMVISLQEIMFIFSLKIINFKAYHIHI